MAGVGNLGSEDDLTITGQPQTPRLVSMVCQGHQANLNIVFRSDEYLGHLCQGAVLATKLGKVAVKEDLMLIANH